MGGIVNPERTDSVLEAPFFTRPVNADEIRPARVALVEARVRALIDAVLQRRSRITWSTLFIHEHGTPRGPWQAGAAFNPDFATHHPAPYADAALHLTIHLHFSDFTTENGGLLVVPGSHRRTTNPGFGSKEDRRKPDPDEIRLTAAEGGVVIMDSRLWHAVAPNTGDFPRVSVAVEIAPR
jgi:ectoine hydroxylase-related dioxygenase (phytanoyl-CoA dioxygenase family)